MPKQDIYRFPHDIHAIDTHYVRAGVDASHLVVRNGRAAFIDCGANSSVPYLLAALDELGVAREDVDFLFLTHIHLDHCGGAGALLRELPAATVVVHPRGAPHLADPGKLEAGTRAVYGERVYDKLYGSLLPIPEERIHSVGDDEVLLLGGAPFRFLHTPGHALHHVAIVDEMASAVFSGDIFGISYRIFDNPAGKAFVFPTTTPTQFDPEQMHASITRIADSSPDAVFLTHFSRVIEIARLAADLHGDVDRFAEIACEHARAPDAEERIRHAVHDHLVQRISAHGSRIDPATRETWLAMDVNLNAAGLLAWQQRISR